MHPGRRARSDSSQASVSGRRPAAADAATSAAATSPSQGSSRRSMRSVSSTGSP